ncbi:MAG TPA: hypothetical protein VGG34_03545 [Opitutaceae bacterium]
MTTKILSAVAAAGFLGAGAAWAADASAQPAAPQEQPAAVSAHPWQGGARGARLRRPALRRMALRRLARSLKLDQNQRDAIRHLHARTMAQVWAIRANDGLTAAQRHDQVKAAFESSRAELRNTLTPEQRDTLDRIESRPERMLLGL